MTHRFRLQQIVRLTSQTAMAQLSHDGLYEVIHLMPADVAGNVSYRVKSPAGERVVVEHHLALSSSP